MSTLSSLLFWCLLVFGCAFLSSLTLSKNSPEWYLTLKKPLWNPPDWIFGPVWTLLYFLMALSAHLLQKTPVPIKEKKCAYMLFFCQLLFNTLWTPLFFSKHLTGWALVDLVILLALTVTTALSFHKIHRLSGLLFLPYFAWSLFACLLNTLIWLDN